MIWAVRCRPDTAKITPLSGQVRVRCLPCPVRSIIPGITNLVFFGVLVQDDVQKNFDYYYRFWCRKKTEYYSDATTFTLYESSACSAVGPRHQLPRSGGGSGDGAGFWKLHLHLFWQQTLRPENCGARPCWAPMADLEFLFYFISHLLLFSTKNKDSHPIVRAAAVVCVGAGCVLHKKNSLYPLLLA